MKSVKPLKGPPPSTKFKTTAKQKIFPMGFVLKFDPPIIGLLYKRSVMDKKKKVYQIHLKNLIFHDDEVEITKLLFYEHPEFLDPDIIEPEQVTQDRIMKVLNLVVKLLEYKEMRMAEMADFLQDVDENDQTGNAFIYDKDPLPDQDETDSQFLDDYDEDVDLDDEETYKKMKLAEIERIKQLERKKLSKLSSQTRK